MSYAEMIVRDCNDTYITGKHGGFPREIIFGDKNASLEKSIPRHRISCLCDLFIFSRMTPVIVKLLDITRLLNTFLPKRNVSFLRYR